MYHLRFKGEHYQIGKRRGEIFNKCGIKFPLHLDDYQLEHGKKSEKILYKHFPEVCNEIKGVTDTINIDYYEFISWMLCMGCCMYNLESNIPQENKITKSNRGCTAFSLVYNNKVYYGRNNDLPSFLKDGSKSEIYTINGKNKQIKFNLTTSSFINGEEGMNENGLVVAMTFVLTNLKDIKPGLNSCFVVRYLLEKASNTKEAYELLKDLEVASNYNILLCDRSGEMMVVECTPVIKNVRLPQEINGIKFICTVNSFISEEMKKYQFTDCDDYFSYERYQTVINSLTNLANNNNIDITMYLENLLKGNYGFMCQYQKRGIKREEFETVWSSIFSLDDLLVIRAEGSPDRVSYKEDKRLMKNK